MGMIDIRQPIQMTYISEFLLQIAKKPLNFIEHINSKHAKLPNMEACIAAQIARQASASIISNCVIELWSSTVCKLHALEPDFPLYPKSVTKFVNETRLPFLSYMSLYYHICNKPFEGTSTAEKSKTLIDMRHELQHDKPEPENDYSTERVEKVLKWKKRLIPLVGKDALIWLPRIRISDEKSAFQTQGEPPIMKFMKYPIAKWAVDVTKEITKEMNDMLFDYKGQLKVVKDSTIEEIVATVDKRLTEEKDFDLWRLWLAGE